MPWRLLALISTGAWFLVFGLFALGPPWGEDRGALVDVIVRAADGDGFELRELSLAGATPRFRNLSSDDGAVLPRVVQGSLDGRMPILPAGPAHLRLRVQPRSGSHEITIDSEIILESNIYCSISIMIKINTSSERHDIFISHCHSIANLFFGRPDE